MTLDEFVGLSVALTGYSPDDLKPSRDTQRVAEELLAELNKETGSDVKESEALKKLSDARKIILDELLSMTKDMTEDVKKDMTEDISKYVDEDKVKKVVKNMLQLKEEKEAGDKVNKDVKEDEEKKKKEAEKKMEKKVREKLEEKVKVRIIENKEITRLAQNIIYMWYVGVWYDLSKDPRCFKGNHHVISSKAYINGLVWKEMGAHPMGFSEEVFGYWEGKPTLPTIG